MEEKGTNYEEAYGSLKRLHDSTNEAVVRLESEKETLNGEIKLLWAKLLNCQKALNINKDIMRNALTQHNETLTAYANEIQLLKDKIKELSKKE